MNTETSKVMFALLRSAVCDGLLSGEEISLYSPDILPEITYLAQKHDVIHLIVFALKKNGLLDEGNKSLESKMLTAVYRCERLKYEQTKLCTALEQAEIPFIPLKGSVLRQYYPEPWMRTSCDIDVLVHKEDLQRVVSYLSDNLGYRRDVYKRQVIRSGSVFAPCLTENFRSADFPPRQPSLSRFCPRFAP